VSEAGLAGHMTRRCSLGRQQCLCILYRYKMQKHCCVHNNTKYCYLPHLNPSVLRAGGTLVHTNPADVAEACY
jgi:hypothetical protein